MPKTKDAFALRNLSYALEHVIGEYSVPDFDYEPCSDNDELYDANLEAYGLISDWLERLIKKDRKQTLIGEMPPYRGFERVVFILAEATAEQAKVSFMLDRFDEHIIWLRRYLLTVQKKLSQNNNVALDTLLGAKRERATFLLWHYEWVKDVLNSWMKSIERYIESQQENLQQQYKAGFAERLRTARRNAKLNQADVAKELGLSSAAYSNYERGLRDLPMFTIYRLTKILGVSADYLLGIKK